MRSTAKLELTTIADRQSCSVVTGLFYVAERDLLAMVKFLVSLKLKVTIQKVCEVI